MILDNDMYFNKDNKRYYLTKTYVYNKLGTDLDVVLNDELDTNLSTLAERNIEYACDMLYDYIEDNSVHTLSTLYDFTQRQEAYNALKRALGYQLFDYIQNGDISYEKGNRVSDTVNGRAIQALYKNNCFHVKYTQIPDVTEW